MVEKAPRSTAKQIQADLQTQGTTVSTRTIRRQLNERRFYGRRPRRTQLLRERHKKAQLEFAKTHPDKPKSFWENVLWTDETKLELFGKAHHLCLQKTKLSLQRKEHLPYIQTWRRFSDVLWLLWCLWHEVP